LIITFFIATIILFVVLSISTFLYTEIKVLRNIGNSLAAYYTAESGIEKVLYYDRQQIPDGAARGICNICSIEDCDPDEGEGSDCNFQSCTDCQIKFESLTANGGSYNVDVSVNQQCRRSTGVLISKGFYEDASRAIRLDAGVKVIGSPPVITGETCEYTAPGADGFAVEAAVNDPDGDPSDLTVVAAIYGEGSENYNQCDDPYKSPQSPGFICTYREISMVDNDGDGIFGSNKWNFNIPAIEYTVTVMATDDPGNCVEVPACTLIF